MNAKSGSAILFDTVLKLLILFAAQGALFGVLAQGRIVTELNKEWRFSRENAPSAQTIKYNDGYWEKINLPHTWNNRDGQDGGNDYYRGTGWYRKWFKVNRAWKDKKIYVKFDGVATTAEVYVNGKFTGTHKGNFGAFCFDITGLCHSDGQNLIAVKVNNAKDTTIAPLRGDFTIFGGIYRKVSLLVLDKLSIDPNDFASSGVYITQEAVSKETASLGIKVKIQNNFSQPEKLNVLCELLDANGRPVQKSSADTIIKAGVIIDYTSRLLINKPHLWQGVSDPYLYTLRVVIKNRNRVADSFCEPVGLRSFSIDPEKGFFLNGVPYKIYGVNRHQDRKSMGWAITEKEHNEDFQLIRELGATGIRLAHYQHAEEFYNLCDKFGMIVWAELALVDDLNSSADLLSNCNQQLTELIKQNYNHPSIIFWSLQNELIPDADTALYTDFVSKLNKLAKQLDPYRLTAVASRSKYPCSSGINSVSDVLGYNSYRGWYEKQPEDFGRFIDEIHSQFPERKIGITEYGAGAGINQHEYPPQKPQPRGAWHPEEWQSYLHEVTWKAIEQRPYLWGTFIWNMFDFAIDLRSEGELAGMNDKGLVTYDRKVKKDAYYFYKAGWNPEPFVYITSRRFTPRVSPSVTVKIYSNCDSVSVNLNGKTFRSREAQKHIYMIDSITLSKGENKISASGYKGGKTFTDSCIWILEDNNSAESRPSVKELRAGSKKNNTINK